MILVDSMARGQIINSGMYTKTLETLKKNFRKFRPYKYCWKSPSTRRRRPTQFLKIQGAIKKSDILFSPTHHACHIFLPQVSASLEPSKMPFLGKCFEGMTKLLKKWLQIRNSKRHKKSIDALVSRWHKANLMEISDS